MEGEVEPCTALRRWNLEGRVEHVAYRKEEVTSSPCDRDTDTGEPGWDAPCTQRQRCERLHVDG